MFYILFLGRVVPAIFPSRNEEERMMAAAQRWSVVGYLATVIAPRCRAAALVVLDGILIGKFFAGEGTCAVAYESWLIHQCNLFIIGIFC